ncbi:phosphoenolpyruvate synthase [Paludibacter sp. 221]|uniref:PEP/pyruvate-binding domain-containing protein n=1 Tax=Paludibacter sp. 221 TaxID=2302939 RepID=UPI0013D39287|nr:PEP/pyruvate-binding domain-containing protein [Paludibacter sp. 221]NDV46902.1 phosphoenolpyruvate synthase [Paludibacter sp. 221]
MNTQSIKKLYFKDTSFADLMRHRIYNVLLYASKYDAFALEEDGRIDEQIFKEYTALNLRYAPRFTLVSTEEEANEQLREHKFELIISMPSGDSINPFEWAKQVKKDYPDIPIVVLTPFSKSVSMRIANEDLSAIDYVFSWLGNADILLAIIKLIEDKMNVKEDVESVGVQVIMLVEDSIHFYSSLVPRLYKYVFTQSRSFMTEALNEHEQMLRMRGRPKILLARSYEEAMSIYGEYKNNMLGIITDVSFPHNGVKDKKAGIELCREIRSVDKYIPLIIQSTEEENHEAADQLRAAFVSKTSKNLQNEIRDKISSNFGFGDFVFVNPHTKEPEIRIRNLRSLQENIYNISDESLLYHVSRNDISRWLYSRAMFPLAEFLKDITVPADGKVDMNNVREVILDAIVQYRKIKNRGIVAVFQRDRFDKYSNFARIGDGSLGGKGRGLAFIDAMIKRNEEKFEEFENSQVTIPKTVVICTDNFTEFMEINQLYPVALSDLPDEEILKYFLKARLPKDLIADIFVFLGAVKSPIAVRSSSLLEDSHYQPFAGIYSTYMVPYNPVSRTHTLMMVTEAIKAVYASVFFADSKAYMTATKNVIDEEKMAIVLQEICGNAYENRFYPSFSGVARSLNYYPIGSEKPEDGIANIAMGLGKYIVDGGTTLRFSPAHPHNILQTSTLDFALRETQTYFNALDLSRMNFVPQVDDGFNLLKINVQDAFKDGTLRYIASTFNVQDMVIYDGLYDEGRKVITFANILQHNVFPLADILKEILNISQIEMGRAIEIEFAVNLDYSPQKMHTFYLLQIRPIVDSKEVIAEDIGSIPDKDTIISCNNALGHGITNDVYDVVYVKPEAFSASKNQLIMYDIEKLNKKMVAENKHYVLVGPGRWGSSDVWLGIPVKWPHISNARVIVESGLSNYRIDPSQGTHFFQNLTSFGVSYFTINPFINDGSYDTEFLNSQPAVYESEYVRHVQFKKPIVIKVDGRKNKGVIMKPEE